MATCNFWYYATDQYGDELPFTAAFSLYIWTGSYWNWVTTLYMPPGTPPESAQSVTVTKGAKYRGFAGPKGTVYYPGYTNPEPKDITACFADFNWIFVKDEPAAPEGGIRNCSVTPTSQVEGQDIWTSAYVANVGDASGNFTLKYYEGTTHLQDVALGTINPGNGVTVRRMFVMVDRDFTITIKVYNNTTGNIDDTCSVTCYLIGGTEYYVKTGGNDGLSGSSWANAWATIDKAARTVPDGSTVHIGFGDYSSEPPGNKIAPQNVGALGISYSPEASGSGGGTGTVTIEKNT